MIPFLDLSAATKELRTELDDAYHRFMDSGWYVLGKEVEQFEREYAEFCEAGHCVGVGTGLDALTLALKALDLSPSDEVIVPSNTYIATWLAVTNAGATIVPVEPDNATFNLSPSDTAAAVTNRTKVILPVNLYGQPVDYDAFLSIAGEANASVVIDNAQAQGARYKGRRVGGIANIECHSFYPSKNLGAYGEAGAVTTNDETIAERIRTLRNYGSKIRYHNEECGTNSRLDALQAAFLRVKLRHLDDWNGRRKEIAMHYLQKLDSCAGNDQMDFLPSIPEWAESVWHLFVVRHLDRDRLQKHLAQEEIGTLIHYPIPPHLSAAYEFLKLPAGCLPIAERLSQSLLSLPLNPHLENADVIRVCNAIKNFADSPRP